MGLRGRGARPQTLFFRDDGPKRWKPKASRADQVISFIESLKLTAGVHAGKPFKLRDWQKDIIYGIYQPGVRTVLSTMGRKNGKTQLATGLAAAHLFGPAAEPRGEVYSAACDRNQAGRVFSELEAIIMADDDLKRRCNIQRFTKKIEVVHGVGAGSIYEALSSDARSAHSLSPSFVICDELAQWPHRNLYDNLVTGTGARENPLVVIISTMCSDPHHVFSEQVRYGQEIIDGLIEDQSFKAFIYTTPMDVDIWDEKNWKTANPALGDFRSLEELRQFAEQAKHIPAKEAVFRNLYLNQPIDEDSAYSFVRTEDWERCQSELDLMTLVKSLKGRPCYGGLDLSSTGKNDLTSLVLIFPMEDGSKIVLPAFWACGEGLEDAENRDRVPYRLWSKQGYLNLIPGRTMNYGFLAEHVRHVVEDYDVKAIAFDKYKIKFFIQACEEQNINLTMVPHGQNFLDMSPSIDALEDEILTWKIRHNGNPILTWNVKNIKIEVDAVGNRRFSKRKATGRIDGAVALAMAAGLVNKTKEVPRKEKFQAFLV